MGHIPVMLDYVVEHLAPEPGHDILDGTYGGGGYTEAILNAADCRVIGVDRDPDAIARSTQTSASFGERFVMCEGPFGDLETLIEAKGIQGLDGLVLDLGVSSFQLDQGERGFSFMQEGPLDMRMSKSGPSAADVVNHASEKALADIIFQLGEERDSRRIARAIVNARTDAQFQTTLQLADLIEKAVGGRRGKKTHPRDQSLSGLAHVCK